MAAVRVNRGVTAKLSRRCTVFIAGERLLECARDRQGRIVGQLATMRTPIF
jgi:hypothetical protein